MSTTLFGLREFGDAGAFLAGAIIPMVPLPEFNAPAGASVYWCRDHMIMSEAGREGALRADACDGKDFDVASLDMEDPDVARWCDRMIAGRMARHKFSWATLALRDGLYDVFWGTQRVIGQCGVDHMIDEDVPRNKSGIPAARAALLRALFGVPNA